MTIGEALAHARRQAGLSVTEVSSRTRVRETLVAAIEADDFAPCGGDFYARGHIRAIAKAVGADPAPLIEEYDARHGAPGWNPPADPQEWRADPAQSASGGRTGRHGTGGHTRPGGEHPGPEQPPAAHPGTAPPHAAPPHAEHQRGEHQRGEPQHAAPARGEHHLGSAGRPPWSDDDTDVLGAASFAPRRGQRRVNVTLVLSVALVLVLGFAIFRLIPGSTRVAAKPAGDQVASRRGAHRHTPATPSARGSASAPGSATPGPSPSAATQTLKPVSASAFGTSGAGSGDNPAMAGLAIDGSPATAWHTDWYTSPTFGGLYGGTGLLLDMGSTVTVSQLRITLGGAGGASLQVRVGDAPALGSLAPVARESGAAGQVAVRLASPARGRYVLIWFTTLPADAAGTYEASIYNVSVAGQP